jgi:hypothetical protein
MTSGMTIVHDLQCPFCDKHPDGEPNYKHLYCKDCADETKVIVKKNMDTNFVCQVCNDDMDKATHVRHWIVTALAYM